MGIALPRLDVGMGIGLPRRDVSMGIAIPRLDVSMGIAQHSTAQHSTTPQPHSTSAQHRTSYHSTAPVRKSFEIGRLTNSMCGAMRVA